MKSVKKCVGPVRFTNGGVFIGAARPSIKDFRQPLPEPATSQRPAKPHPTSMPACPPLKRSLADDSATALDDPQPLVRCGVASDAAHPDFARMTLFPFSETVFGWPSERVSKPAQGKMDLRGENVIWKGWASGEIVRS